MNKRFAGSNPVFLIALLMVPVPVLAQTPSQESQASGGKKELSKFDRAESLEAQKRTFAVSLITSLAEEARSYRDLALRPHVLASAASMLWESDREAARQLFRRAWAAAEAGDADELTVKVKDGAPPMVSALRRIAGRDLRHQVLSQATRRDPLLGEEFLSKLKEATKKESNDAGSDRESNDSWEMSDAASKRLLVARQLLDEGQIEAALEFAGPALNQVNQKSISFLSALRRRVPDAADQRYASLLAHAEFDPRSDANTSSGLSSYAFTPGLYLTFSPEGGARWTPTDEPPEAPNLPVALRNRFFQVAASILLRPLAPPDQDFTSSGRTGKYMVIQRLLPLFDQYAPNTASALRSQLKALAVDPINRGLGADHALLSQGLQEEESAANALDKLQERLDRCRTSQERDSIYLDAAVVLANQGNARSRDLTDKIEDSTSRADLRRYVDFELVRFALKKPDAPEAVRLAKEGKLTRTQRAWAYTQAAKLLLESQRPRALLILEEAAEEVRRIDGDVSDRAGLLVGVATQLVTADPVRAWEIMSEAVRFANSAEQFTGESVQLQFSLLATKNGVKIISFGSEDLRLYGVFRALTKNDLHRSIDLAKSFQNEAPRAAALLAIASAILENKTSVRE